MKNAIFAFAANSTNQADYCIRKVGDMKFKSEEMDEEDTEPTMKTLLKIEGDSRVTMTRSGKRNQQLIIEKGERHQCHYDNGYADWIMGIQGYGIENGLEDNGGTLNFKYSMDINAMFASENEVNIVVKECEENA